MDEKESLYKNNDENKSSDEEDNVEKDNNTKSEEELKKIFELKKNVEAKTKVETNQVEDLLLIKEKIKKIRGMKLDANKLLENKKYEEAIDKYKETINTVLDEMGNYTIDMKVLNSIKGEIIVPCYQNIALCNMKLQKWLKVKTYTKKILGLDKDNIKASCRLCLANIKLGHLKKADIQLEELEKKIGGTPELEELEKIYEINKLNSEGNNGEFLRKMGRKLRDGKINMYSDKKTKIEIVKDKTPIGYIGKLKKYLYNLICCCKKKKTKKA